MGIWSQLLLSWKTSLIKINSFNNLQWQFHSTMRYQFQDLDQRFNQSLESTSYGRTNPRKYKMSFKKKEHGSPNLSMIQPVIVVDIFPDLPILKIIFIQVSILLDSLISRKDDLDQNTLSSTYSVLIIVVEKCSQQLLGNIKCHQVSSSIFKYYQLSSKSGKAVSIRLYSL